MSEQVPEPQSVSEILRARRKKLEERKSVDLPIPGFDGLFATYKQLGYATLRDFSIGDDATAEEEIVLSWNLLTAACTKLFFRWPDGRDEAVSDGFDNRLARAVIADDSDLETAHEVINAVFPTESAVVAQAIAYSAWASFATNDLDVELGKASKGTQD